MKHVLPPTAALTLSLLAAAAQAQGDSTLSTMLASYGTYSPYGFTGGYYYTRLTYAF